MALRACSLATSWCDVRAQSSSKARLSRRAKNSRFKASQLPPGCLRCDRHRRACRATIFRIRERRRIACALSLLTVFKFVAIMRQSAGNGKRNTAQRRKAPASGAIAGMCGWVSARARPEVGALIGDARVASRRGVRRVRVARSPIVRCALVPRSLSVRSTLVQRSLSARRCRFGAPRGGGAERYSASSPASACLWRSTQAFMSPAKRFIKRARSRRSAALQSAINSLTSTSRV